MKPIWKITLQIFGVFLIPFVAIYLWLHITFGGVFTGPSYDKSDLIKNYEKRTEEINEVKSYIQKITPPSYHLRIEFNSRSRIDFSLSQDSDTAKYGRIHWFQEWDINPYNYKQAEEYSGFKKEELNFEEAIQKLGWSSEELSHLYGLLRAARCIGVSIRDEICTIDFQRSGFGMYSYVLFENKLDQSQKEKYNDGCTYIYYKDNIVLEYGGGAIGPQCF